MILGAPRSSSRRFQPLRRPLAPWIWVEPQCLSRKMRWTVDAKRYASNQRFVWILENFGNSRNDQPVQTQIVFMPQKSTIQHAFPLHLGADLDVDTRFWYDFKILKSFTSAHFDEPMSSLRPSPCPALLLFLLAFWYKRGSILRQLNIYYHIF